jgi:ABC-2 type transport system ATP-binding protein
MDARVREAGDLDRAAGLLGEEAVVDRGSQRVRVPVTGGADEMLARAQLLSDHGVGLADVAVRRPTLDDVFLALTGQPAQIPADDTQEVSA